METEEETPKEDKYYVIVQKDNNDPCKSWNGHKGYTSQAEALTVAASVAEQPTRYKSIEVVRLVATARVEVHFQF